MSPSLDSPPAAGLAAGLAAALVVLACLAAPSAGAAERDVFEPDVAERHPAADTVRVAVFNIRELGAEKIDQGAGGVGDHPQLLAAAEILRAVRPDILLLNEIDYDPNRRLARDFVDRYLRPERAGSEPLDYPHLFDAPVNTGVPSGYDLNNDGDTAGPDDGWGYGRYPGQYGMALLSRWPIAEESARTFRALRWVTMPGHLMPDGRDGRPAWYDAEEASLLRLSSKSFWDVPVRLPWDEPPGSEVHLLASHPTPPVFDGEEDRNGRRNYDEIRLVADYLHGGERADWIVDDRGRRGGLDPAARCVVVGDLNADPVRGDAAYGAPAIRQLLDHPRLVDPEPRSDGDLGVHPERGAYPGESTTRTAGFGRIDYALPCTGLNVRASGVYLPTEDDPRRALVTGEAGASDHFLVWVDLAPSASN